MTLRPTSFLRPFLRTCSFCGKPVDGRVMALAREIKPPLLTIIQADAPGWLPNHGICPSCLLRFVAQLQVQRSHTSLQPSTSPPGTFPYYHPAEETVLPQAIRLPAHEGWDGSGVTVGFLDSGYYPHPDLSALRIWPDEVAWSRLSSDHLRTTISAQPMRLAHYVDLTDERQVEGLEAASLWDGAGDSWHGQMTSVVALGNGLLSGGRFRGYAHGAGALLIKIGRGGGRIPEADILRGLEWLLTDDRWQRYGVRVLNVSVGGDFNEPWRHNALSLAAEELSRRGLFIAAAAGNRGHDIVLPPAQSPSVLTVGGIDDFNRRWSPIDMLAIGGHLGATHSVAAHLGATHLGATPAAMTTLVTPNYHASDTEAARLELYHHNWTEIESDSGPLRKPEILALARWLPAPILPPNPLFAEMVALGQIRDRLLAGEQLSLTEINSFFAPLPTYRKRRSVIPARMQRVRMWQSLRERMNAHKWIAPYYQHVDGTSVAVAQVSAVAAQMVQANPALTPTQIKELILWSALPMPYQVAERTGAGVLQPTRAVAAAMRAAGGPLVGLPFSGDAPEVWPAAPTFGEGAAQRYVGLWAPNAHAVSVVGNFNDWLPGAWPLHCIREGWWHGVLQLPPGRAFYRFWVESEDKAVGQDKELATTFIADPENPLRAESGYTDDHSTLIIPQ